MEHHHHQKERENRTLRKTLRQFREGERDQRGKDRIVAVSLVTDANPHFLKIAEAIEQDARRYGYQVKVDSCEFNVDRQIEQVRNFISLGVKAMVLTPCDAKKIAPAVRAANEAGIPVFTADTACSAEERMG